MWCSSSSRGTICVPLRKCAQNGMFWHAFSRRRPGMQWRISKYLPYISDHMILLPPTWCHRLKWAHIGVYLSLIVCHIIAKSKRNHFIYMLWAMGYGHGHWAPYLSTCSFNVYTPVRRSCREESLLSFDITFSSVASWVFMVVCDENCTTTESIFLSFIFLYNLFGMSYTFQLSELKLNEKLFSMKIRLRRN